MTWLLFNVLVCTVCVQSGLQFLMIWFHKIIFSQWGPMFNYILILQQFWLDQQHKIFKTLSVFMVYHSLVGWFMVFNAIFNNISVILWQSVLLAEETRVPGENQWPVASHWQTLSHNVVSSTPRLSRIRTYNLSSDRSWLHRTSSCKSNYHTITITTNPFKLWWLLVVPQGLVTIYLLSLDYSKWFLE